MESGFPVHIVGSRDPQSADIEIKRRLTLFYEHHLINHQTRSVLVFLASDGGYASLLNSISHLQNCIVITIFELGKVSHRILRVPSIKKEWHQLLEEYNTFINYYGFPPPPGGGPPRPPPAFGPIYGPQVPRPPPAFGPIYGPQVPRPSPPPPPPQGPRGRGHAVDEHKCSETLSPGGFVEETGDYWECDFGSIDEKALLSLPVKLEALSLKTGWGFDRFMDQLVLEV